MNKRTQIARWISIVGHPFTFVVLLVATSSWKLHGGKHAVSTTAIVYRGYARPAWPVYLESLLVRPLGNGRCFRAEGSAGVIHGRFRPAHSHRHLFCLRDRSAEMVRGLAAVAILIGILAGLNRWIKLSVHMTLATFATIIICRSGSGFRCGVAHLPSASRVVAPRAFTSFACRSRLADSCSGLVMVTVTLWL